MNWSRCWPSPPTAAPSAPKSSGEIRDWLRGALARLNPRIAEMFALRFFEGKDNPEIARLLNTTPGNRGGDPVAHARPSGERISSVPGRSGMTPEYNSHGSRPGASRVGNPRRLRRSRGGGSRGRPRLGAASAEAAALPLPREHIRGCADFQALIPDYRAGRLPAGRAPCW